MNNYSVDFTLIKVYGFLVFKLSTRKKGEYEISSNSGKWKSRPTHY